MTLEDFKNAHIGMHAFIIGKGPSLDTVEKVRTELDTGIVMGLNESIHKIESLGLKAPAFVVQQDSNLEFDCVPKNSWTTHFMNSWQHFPEDRKGNWIAKKQHVAVSPYNPNAVLYRPDFFKGESECSLSAIIALKIANFMGIQHVTLCCFDALKNNYNGPNTYAECVGKQREGSHRSHNAIIVKTAHEIMKSVKCLHPTVDI